MDCCDRAAGDPGNIVALEHLTLPDQQIASLFYVVAPGLTRDPCLMTGVNNPASGKTVFTIEQVRSMKHPLFMRPLVNRDPGQSNLNRAPGHDTFLWATPSD